MHAKADYRSGGVDWDFRNYRLGLGLGLGFGRWDLSVAGILGDDRRPMSREEEDDG